MSQVRSSPESLVADCSMSALQPPERQWCCLLKISQCLSNYGLPKSVHFLETQCSAGLNSERTTKAAKLNRNYRNIKHTQTTCLFVIFRIVRRNDVCELEIRGWVHTQCVVDRVVSLILRDDERKDVATRLHYHLTQVVRAVDTYAINEWRRIIYSRYYHSRMCV